MSEQLRIFSDMEMNNLIQKGISTIEAYKKKIQGKRLLETIVGASELRHRINEQPRANYIICSAEVANALNDLKEAQ